MPEAWIPPRSEMKEMSQGRPSGPFAMDGEPMWTEGKRVWRGRTCSFQSSTASETDMFAWVFMQGSLKPLLRPSISKQKKKEEERIPIWGLERAVGKRDIQKMFCLFVVHRSRYARYDLIHLLGSPALRYKHYH